MHVLPKLAELEAKYKDQPFVVVGVHSAKCVRSVLSVAWSPRSDRSIDRPTDGYPFTHTKQWNLRQTHAINQLQSTNPTKHTTHPRRFENEKASANIREAIARYRIQHPVVNDKDMQVGRRRVVVWAGGMDLDRWGPSIARQFCVNQIDQSPQPTTPTKKNQMFSAVGVQSWPSLVLVSPKGTLISIWPGA
jgi:hypothetical protein